MKDTTEAPDSKETIAAVDPLVAEDRRGPTWREWVLSILVAVLLSVTAMLLLGGYEAFRSDRSASGAGDCGFGARSGNCPHSTAGK
jgi:hypothetical protein